MWHCWCVGIPERVLGHHQWEHRQLKFKRIQTTEPRHASTSSGLNAKLLWLCHTPPAQPSTITITHDQATTTPTRPRLGFEF